MTEQGSPKRRTPTAKSDEEIRSAIEKARAEAKAALTRAKAEERARLKAEAALTEIQEALATAQAEAEQERRARVQAEQVRAEAERALEEAKSATRAEVDDAELLTRSPGKNGAEQRVSFIVRLTVNERGQIRRTEVEHAQSAKKKLFPTLDVQGLAAFMQEHIGSPAIMEPATSSAPEAESLEGPTRKPHRPASRLIISDIGVFHAGTRDRALTLSSNAPFEIQARFALQGSEAAALTDQAPPYEMRVYATEMTGGTPRLLTTDRGNLERGVLEYTARTQAPPLPSGLYRLVTLVMIHAPNSMAGHYEGPIIKIAEDQPSVKSAAQQADALSR